MGESKFTSERVEKIIGAIRAGTYPSTAARYAGVGKRTFQHWLEVYPEFAAQVEEAEAAFEVRNVAIIQSEASKRWVAAAWLLERRFPEKYGKVDRVEIYKVQKDAEALVEELRADGITDVTVEEVLREREALVRRSQNALPSPSEKQVA